MYIHVYIHVYTCTVVSPNSGAMVQRHATFSPQNFKKLNMVILQQCLLTRVFDKF